ncbi:DNA primase [Jutongia huaianensis]|uniref:DNA primase n=1 Tax=Jutongia huaianensis TaxID=2763668 RepID=A0ABR7N1N2_9FIRM|nr:DNA primase [Jutongia huaianensis]MBC8562544.1 DNA primase [Jutongia huaianensis]
MPWYSEEQIEEVRSRSDIVSVIGRYVRLKRTGSGYTGLCPFHNEKTPSFYVNPARQMYKCFGCGVGGNVLTFVMEYENLTFPEAMEMLAEQAGIDLPKQEMTAQQKQQEGIRLTLLEINKKAARYYFALLKSPRGKVGYDYLTGRGLTDETILHFGLGFAGQGGGELYQYLKKEGYSDQILKETGLFKMDERGVYDKFWNRVMFPIMDVNNRVIGFGGRVMGDAKPKYLNSPETKIFDKSRNLFGLNYAKRGKRNNMILCEGYMDVIALHQAGFTNAVASLGTAFTEQQANLIRRYTDEVLLTYDSDGAGVKAAMRAIPMLRRAGITGKVIHMEPYKDPDEFIKNLGADEFEKRIEEAQNSFFFEIEVTKRNYSMSDPDQKTKFIHEIARKLLVFEDKIQRNNYLEAVAARYNIKTEDLQQLVVRYGNQMPSGYEEVMEERQQERLRKGRKKELREGISYSYRLLLSWLIEEPQLFRQISQWIKPEDFEEGLYRTVAKELYEQMEKEELEPARIIGHFTEVEEQNKVASMFQTSFGSEIQAEEKKKAITDLILKIKEHSLERQAGEVTDLNELQKLVQQKKMLQGAVKLHIS